ncbi:MAG: hypothetical protein LBR79_04070 [Oscillospiraceae bacterium]|jgi:hypothetical protein|nr:hypothetical protein [Oscillospiraceae bacterium]
MKIRTEPEAVMVKYSRNIWDFMHEHCFVSLLMVLIAGNTVANVVLGVACAINGTPLYINAPRFI